MTKPVSFLIFRKVVLEAIATKLRVRLHFLRGAKTMEHQESYELILSYLINEVDKALKLQNKTLIEEIIRSALLNSIAWKLDVKKGHFNEVSDEKGFSDDLKL